MHVDGQDEASVEVRCLPAWTRRMSVVGAEVRNERSWRRVGIVVSEGTVRGMATRFFVPLAFRSCAFGAIKGIDWVAYCLRIAA